MRRIATALLPAVLLVLTGCQSLSLQRYSTFDEWFTGDPLHENPDWGMEQEAQGMKMLYGGFLAAPYLLRNLCRIVMIPVAVPYYAWKREEDEGTAEPEHPTDLG